jgi:hypothetical protein
LPESSVWDIPGHYEVLEQTGSTARFSLTGASARTRHLVEYALAQDFAEEVLGREEVVDAGGTTSFTIFRPKQHPYFASLYAREVTFEEELGEVRLPSDEALEIERDWIVAVIDYESADYGSDANDEPRRIVNLTFGSETVSVGESKWEYSSGDINAKPEGITIGRVDYEVIFPRTPWIPAAVFSLANHVNSVAMTYLPEGLDGSVGKVKLGTPQATATTTLGNQTVYSLRLAFAWREVEWNKSFNVFTGQFEEITHVASGRKKYLTSDLNQIFTS